MTLKSTPTRYGAVAIAIHWTSAIAIVATFGLGLMAAGTTDPVTEVTLVRGHIVLGSLVLILTLLRIGWWLWGDRRPAPVAGQPRAAAAGREDRPLRDLRHDPADGLERHRDADPLRRHAGDHRRHRAAGFLRARAAASRTGS